MKDEEEFLQKLAKRLLATPPKPRDESKSEKPKTKKLRSPKTPKPSASAKQ
jgi:hypothetical protein